MARSESKTKDLDSPQVQTDRMGQLTASDLSGRERLLLAAASEFAAKGFHGSSVLEIADAAGVKQPLVNYHFGSKEGLWHEVLHSALAEPIEQWVGLYDEAKGVNPLDNLKQILRAFGVHVARHPEVHQLIFKEVALAGPRLDWLVSNYIRPFHDMLDKAIAQCQSQGYLRDFPLAYASILMTNMLTSVSSAFPLVRRLYRVKRMSTVDAERYIDCVIDVLLHGMLAHSSIVATATAAKSSTPKGGAVSRRGSLNRPGSSRHL